VIVDDWFVLSQHLIWDHWDPWIPFVPAAQPRVWGKFCLFCLCLFSFGSYAVGLSPIWAGQANGFRSLGLTVCCIWNCSHSVPVNVFASLCSVAEISDLWWNVTLEIFTWAWASYEFPSQLHHKVPATISMHCRTLPMMPSSNRVPWDVIHITQLSYLLINLKTRWHTAFHFNNLLNFFIVMNCTVIKYHYAMRTRVGC